MVVVQNVLRWIRGNTAVLTIALLIVLVAGGALYLRSRQGGTMFKEGAITWGCPAGKSWGWGPEGNGKCCDPGNKNCVGSVKVSSDGKDYRCPTGKTFGWGSNAGKCCDAGTNNNCVGATIQQAVRNTENKGESDADLAEKGLVRDPLTGDVVTKSEMKKREKKRRDDAKAQGKTAPPKLKDGDKFWGCPPGKKWGWGAGAGKCCDSGTADKNCVGPTPKEVGKRCAGLPKPAKCAAGYKVQCQRTSSDVYAWRCCKKFGGDWKCDDAGDSKAMGGGTSGGTVPARLSNGKCPPGTNEKGGKCHLYKKGDYNNWFDRFYVGKSGGNCPPGTTGSYKFADGSSDGSKCQVTDENKYIGWKKMMSGQGGPAPTAAPAPTPAPVRNAILYSDRDGGGDATTMAPGEEKSDLKENTSSVFVPDGTVVELYLKKDFKGKCIKLWGGNHTYNLGAIPDTQGDGCAQISPGQYTNTVCRSTWGSNNDGCWNDSASSVKVYTA